MSGRITVALARDDHAEALAAFYRVTWDPGATPETVMAARRAAANDNLAVPGEVPPTAVVLEGDRVIGHCGSIPQRLWDGASERPAYWVKGLMVLPEFRNGPVGFLVLKELARHLPCSTSMLFAPAARRLLTALGYTEVGAVPNFVRALRPGAMARELDLEVLTSGGLPRWVARGISTARRSGLAAIAATGAGFVMDVAAAGARLGGARVEVQVGASPAREELDRLWERARSGIAAGQVRDGRYLLWRFANVTKAADGDLYVFVSVRHDGDLLGTAVVRRPRTTGDPRLGAVRVAALADVVYPPERRAVGLALVGAVERAASGLGADAVLASSGHPVLASVLRRQVYVRLAGNIHFFVRDITDGARWPVATTSWWLSRGDGESDATF